MSALYRPTLCQVQRADGAQHLGWGAIPSPTMMGNATCQTPVEFDVTQRLGEYSRYAWILWANCKCSSSLCKMKEETN